MSAKKKQVKISCILKFSDAHRANIVNGVVVWCIAALAILPSIATGNPAVIFCCIAAGLVLMTLSSWRWRRQLGKLGCNVEIHSFHYCVCAGLLSIAITIALSLFVESPPRIMYLSIMLAVTILFVPLYCTLRDIWQVVRSRQLLQHLRLLERLFLYVGIPLLADACVALFLGYSAYCCYDAVCFLLSLSMLVPLWIPIYALRQFMEPAPVVVAVTGRRLAGARRYAVEAKAGPVNVGRYGEHMMSHILRCQSPCKRFVRRSRALAEDQQER